MSNIYSQNIIRKKNIELTIRKIFEIKQKTNEFNNVILNNLSGYQQELFNKYKRSRDIIIDFSNKEYEELKQVEEEKNKGKLRKSSKKETDPKSEDKKNITNTNIYKYRSK